MSKYPKGWDYLNLGNVCVTSQYGINTPAMGGKYPVLGMKNLQDGKINLNGMGFVDLSDDELEKFRLNPGDLLINRTNSIELVGKTALFDLIGNYVFASYLVRFILDSEKVSPEYLNYFCTSHDGNAQMQRLATKGVSQANINPTELKKNFYIPLPPLPEQRKIAEILSTWDKAIDLTRQLIAARQQLKKGLMQRLLTGEKRFSEFQGAWKTLTLQELCDDFVSGGTPSTTKDEYWDGDIPWITGADFGDLKISKIRRYITRDAIKNSAANIVKKDNILVVTRVGVGKVALAPFDIAISQDTTGLIPKKDLVIPDFLLFALAYSIPNLVKYNQGTSINGVTRKDLVRHEILFPDIMEQRKIADALLACCYGIDLLAQKLDLLQQQKKGLMQQLLTGNIRVKPD
jgi:type I restriction enzyme S subunit